MTVPATVTFAAGQIAVPVSVNALSEGTAEILGYVGGTQVDIDQTNGDLVIMITVVSVGVVIVCRTDPISPPIENS